MTALDVRNIKPKLARYYYLKDQKLLLCSQFFC